MQCHDTSSREIAGACEEECSTAAWTLCSVAPLHSGQPSELKLISFDVIILKNLIFWLGSGLGLGLQTGSFGKTKFKKISFLVFYNKICILYFMPIF